MQTVLLFASHLCFPLCCKPHHWLPLYLCSESTAFVTQCLSNFSDTTRKGLYWAKWHTSHMWHLSFSFWVSVIILHVSVVPGACQQEAVGWWRRTIWYLKAKIVPHILSLGTNFWLNQEQCPGLPQRTWVLERCGAWLSSWTWAHRCSHLSMLPWVYLILLDPSVEA